MSQGYLTRRKFIKVALGAGLGAMAMIESGAAGENPEALQQGESGGGKEALVRIPDVSIRMRSPDSVLVGISEMEVIEIALADVLKFHGYCAGGVAFSFRAAQEAFRLLYGDSLPLRQNLKVRTSIHCCQAGALAYITGARTDFGAIPSRGDLILIPEEMKRIVFTDKTSGKKVTLRPLFDPHKIFSPLFQKVRKEPGFAPQVRKALQEAVQEYIYGPAEKLFKLEPDEKTT